MLISSEPSASHSLFAGGGSFLNIDENTISAKRNKGKHNK